MQAPKKNPGSTGSTSSQTVCCHWTAASACAAGAPPFTLPSRTLPPCCLVLQVLQYMKHQINGAGGVLVITLHQPGSEVSCLIDDLLLLGYGGSPVFMGPWGAAMSYFTGHLGELRGQQEQPVCCCGRTTQQQQ